MARTSRFTLALPGSRSAASKKEKKEKKAEEESWARNGLPPPSVNSKAQQLLGTLDPFMERRLVNARSGPNRNLQKKGNLMNDTAMEDGTEDSIDKASEARNASVGSGGGPPSTVSGGHFGGPGTGHLRFVDGRKVSHTLQPRPSSPVLREKYLDQQATTTSDETSHQTHHTRSSSTLHSFYDPQNSPLAISQQTSASSARDMALRKGHPIITETKDYFAYANTAPLSADEGMGVDSSGLRQESPDPRLDISKLFPKPQPPTKGDLFPPYTVVHSPQPLSEASESPHSADMPDIGLRPWRSLRKMISKDSISGKSDRSCSPYLEVPVSRKVNVRKPSPGIKDWFDDIMEDEDIDELAELDGHTEYNYKETIVARAAVKEEPKQLEPMHRCTQLCEQDQLNTQRGFSVSYRSSQTVSDFGGSSVCPTTVWSGEIDNTRSVSSRASRRSKTSRASVFISSDLRQESVLALSSSEDEGGAASVSKEYLEQPVDEEEPDVMIFNGRTLIKRTSTAPTEVLSLRSSRARISVRSTSIRASASISAGAAPIASHKHSSKGNPKEDTPLVPSHVQSNKEKLQEELLRPTPIRTETLRPRTSGAESHKRSSWFDESPPPPSSPTMSEGRSHQTRKSRIMAVTREEESLLEAMRQKRSTMQKHSFVEGYKTALHNVTATTMKTTPIAPPVTPSTAEALSFLQLNTAAFPSPPKFSRKMSKSASPGRGVASAASASSCTSSPTEILQPPSLTSFLPAQTPISPSLKISVADILPSPTNSRGSPVTPPSSHELLNTQKSSVRRNGISQSLSRSPNTAFLTLDGEDGRIEEEDMDAEELAIWGLNEWSATEGLVAVR
ncbi:MAG: hypothetical protein M1812_001346 [Candelaria pacifica]|nr:MAG: hypothetical protein M1812_001346 [Candelaria pacifica]